MESNRWALRPLAALALAALLVTAFGATVAGGHDELRPADLIVARHLAARGGLAAIWRVRSARLYGRFELRGGPQGPAVITLARDPDRIRTEIRFGARLFLQGYDGHVAWALDPFCGDTLARVLEAGAARSVVAGAGIDGALVDWLDKGSRLEGGEPDSADGRRAWRLELTAADGLVDRFWIDSLSLLQSKWEGERVQDGQPVVFVSWLRDWREAGGVKWAFRIDSGPRDRPPGQRFVFDSVRVNVETPPELFAMPTPRAPP